LFQNKWHLTSYESLFPHPSLTTNLLQASNALMNSFSFKSVQTFT
jgi:hypothetical protein